MKLHGIFFRDVVINEYKRTWGNVVLSKKSQETLFQIMFHTRKTIKSEGQKFDPLTYKRVD